MKKIQIQAHKNGLLIKGFTPTVAVALITTIESIKHQSFYCRENGDILRMSDHYTVYTTAMLLQLALTAIGEDKKEYSFSTDVSNEEIKIGDINRKLNLNSFEFSNEQLSAVADLNEVANTLTSTKPYKTTIETYIIENGDTLDENATISSIYEFTDKTPHYTCTFDSGGRDTEEGFATAVIAIGADKLYYPYIAINNEGQRVDSRDLKENYENSSFFLLDAQPTAEEAKKALLSKYDECVERISPIMILDEDDYWVCPWESGAIDSLETNFLKGFTTIFDGYFEENFQDARSRLNKILNYPHRIESVVTDNKYSLNISQRELEALRNMKEFKSFVFKEV